MHDRYLSGVPNSKLSTEEAFHWYQSTALFNNKISGPIDPSERDAAYATRVCLGVITFFYIEAKTPEEAWPLKPPSSSDLNWLSLSEGKKTIWKYTRPLKGKQVIQTLLPLETNPNQPLPPRLAWRLSLPNLSNSAALTPRHLRIIIPITPLRWTFQGHCTVTACSLLS